ncbi:MAG: HypC/HybG/HupF family hydrogenase formation chaperone [Solirubrobacterales bacterium]
MSPDGFPVLPAADPAWEADACTHDGCITCGDVAVPLRVVLLDVASGLALCENAEGARETVETALVDDVVVGDELLVHASTAIARLGAES